MDNINIDLIRRAILKRLFLIFAVTAVGTSIGVLVAYVIPPVYRSQATILVESQQIPGNLAQTTVTTSANERLQLIEQRLLTRENLLDLEERLGLFDDELRLSPAAKVGKIRGSTNFERLSLNNRRRGPMQVSAFIMSYQDSDPGVAARVANEYVTLVLEQNLQARRERASETLEFFEEEVTSLKRRMENLEEDLVDFKNANAESMPDTLSLRRSELAGLRERRFELTRRINQLSEDQRILKIRLERGDYGEEFQAAGSPLQQTLQTLRAQEVQLLTLYAAGHPRVRQIKAQIAQVQAQLASSTPLGPDEGALEERAFIRSELERKITLVDQEIALLQAEIDRTNVREADLEASIAVTAAVGLDLNRLQREYDSVVAEFNNANAKRVAAETGEKLEANRQAERFEVIEQAQVPDAPISPNRPLIAAAGMAGSFGLAVALAVLVEIFNRAVWTVQDLERRVGLRPLVAVPYIITEGERRANRRKLTLQIAVVLIALPAALYAIDRYYLPLDLIFDRIISRLGLAEFIGNARDRLGL
ncbi:MAG: Wzz/FepE/Etk N-terminal domain-containing protein [Pseudomonadota bacterium]